ncbi:MAG TPA: alpha/beta hydrolase [Candidatus Elarobacter sp.]|nr:alpha/beta hydrolase [Candidatus Elarobacter sp.]
MNDLPEPAFVTFRLEGTSVGPTIAMSSRPCGPVRVTAGQQHWLVQHRTHDLTTVVELEDGRRYIVGFGPTWLTTFQRLRSPSLASRVPPCGSASHTPAPAPIEPAPSATPALRTIGTVVALGPAIYNVEDRGAATCPNGRPGHALHLSSRTNNPRHQLSDVVIDLASLRFCMVRFGLRSSGGAGADATSEEHFADVGGYWVETDGVLDGTVRIAGIAAGHMVWRYRLLDMRFPESLPPEAFEVAADAPPFDAAPYLRPQRLVDIGGRRLNLYCTGRGSPTVVLEANGASDTVGWRYVQPLLGARVHVCSYDRAGLGFSDPGPLPRDAAAVASDLKMLLTRAGIAPPYVLVGYSDGAHYVRLFADRYLDEVAGVVLVEPAFEADDEKRVDAAIPRLAHDAARQTAVVRACAAGSAPEPPRPGTALRDACIPPADPQLPDALNAAIVQQSRRPGWWSTYASEDFDAADAALAQVAREQRSYGNVPLTLVTAKDVSPRGLVSAAEERTIETIVEPGRAKLLTYSSRSERVNAEACDHGDIVTSCAATVASAVMKVVEQSRESRP